MKTRIITMIAILACVIPALLFGGVLIHALVGFIIIVGLHEVCQLTDHEWPFGVELFLIISVLLSLFMNAQLRLPYVGFICIILLAMPVFSAKMNASDAFLCMAFTAFFITIGTGFMAMYNHEPLFIWYIILATYVCDSFAYLCGRFFGRHKLCERISPKKTIEGSVGGWFFAAVISFLFAYFFIDHEHLLAMGLGSVFLPIFGQIGDLAFSAIKRYFKIKDFGNLLPGHGGVLDRVDSLLFNLTVFYFIFTAVNLL